MKRPDERELAAALVRLGRGPGHCTERDLQPAVDDAARTAHGWLCFFIAKGHFIEWSEIGNGYTVVAELFRGAPAFPMLQRYLGPIARHEDPDLEHLVRRFRAVARRYTLNWVKHYIGDRAPHERKVRRILLATVRQHDLSERGQRIYFGSPRPGNHDPISSSDHVDELVARCDDRAQVPDLIRATRVILNERVNCAPWIEVSQVASDYLQFFVFGLLTSLDADSPDGPGKALIIQEWDAYWNVIRDEFLERFLERTECVSREVAERVFRAHEDWLKASIEAGADLNLAPFVVVYFPGMAEDEYRGSSYRRMMDWLRAETRRYFMRKFGPDIKLVAKKARRRRLA